ncbi:MAG: transposase [Anaerolineae bacterium]|nr:transposase [Anaerolineae bacterium]MDW8098117.1 transposase [Anaerolineae bacterium]
MLIINSHAAGADIGAEQIYVCILGPNQTPIVRAFRTYTITLQALATWLVENSIQTIAMESTGVYGIPLFKVLEQRSIQDCLISRNIAHRLTAHYKTNVLDCQWIQTLHSLGLLTESFRPEADLIALRTLLHHRAQLTEHRSPHTTHAKGITFVLIKPSPMSRGKQGLPSSVPSSQESATHRNMDCFSDS